MGNTSTKTSAFGVSKRESHDSSRFYNSRLYSGTRNISKAKTHIERKIPEEYLNEVFCKSSEQMGELPNNSIHLMVTSPPYNVGKEYDEDFTLEEHLALLYRVFKETYKKLIVGGRVCINIANIGRKPYIPLNSYVTQIMLKIGYLMRGEIIWNKGASAGSSCAWGSWLSASNPALRDVHEYILVFSKGDFSRVKDGKKSTIMRDGFLDSTKSIWSFSTESAKKVKHPAPFPVDLPYKCIQLYTFEGDIILDTFMGSGSTALAAIRTNRYFVGYDIDKTYVQNSKDRINHETGQLRLFS